MHTWILEEWRTLLYDIKIMRCFFEDRNRMCQNNYFHEKLIMHINIRWFENGLNSNFSWLWLRQTPSWVYLAPNYPMNHIRAAFEHPPKIAYFFLPKHPASFHKNWNNENVVMGKSWQFLENVQRPLRYDLLDHLGPDKPHLGFGEAIISWNRN